MYQLRIIWCDTVIAVGVQRRLYCVFHNVRCCIDYKISKIGEILVEKQHFFPTICRREMPVRLSVTLVNCIETSEHILQLFSSSCKSTVVAFLRHASQLKWLCPLTSLSINYSAQTAQPHSGPRPPPRRRETRWAYRDHEYTAVWLTVDGMSPDRETDLTGRRSCCC